MAPLGISPLIWVSPEDPNLKITIDPSFGYANFHSAALIVRELDNGKYLALYPGNPDGHDQLSARVFDPKTGLVISDEIYLKSGPDSSFNWHLCQVNMDIEGFRLR